jgi:hypothetical protein
MSRNVKACVPAGKLESKRCTRLVLMVDAALAASKEASRDSQLVLRIPMSVTPRPSQQARRVGMSRMEFIGLVAGWCSGLATILVISVLVRLLG